MEKNLFLKTLVITTIITTLLIITHSNETYAIEDLNEINNIQTLWKYRFLVIYGILEIHEKRSSGYV